MAGPEDGLIVRLGQVEEAATVGGKGASLDRLIRMGFRVPPAFCVTTQAFRLQRQFHEEVHGAWRDLEAPPWLGSLAAGPLVPAVAEAVRGALEALVRDLTDAGVPDPRFAVRSSAIGEDGSEASYAGLHETELGLTPAEVPGAIARCWASLWSAPAVAYRRRRGLGADDAAMAVVVQALVPAEAAAIVFTRHPVTGREDQLVLTAVRGLGDAMVSGTVTPDTYVVDKASRSTVEVERGEDPTGPALDTAGLADIVALSLAVEEGFGVPVDIEAAQAAGLWYLLQARPITTLAPAARA